MAQTIIDTRPVSTRSTLSEKDTNAINNNFTELYNRASGSISVEEYGAGTSDDSTAFSNAIAAAAAADVPLLAYGDEYNIDPSTLGVLAVSADIRFGRNTVITNLQSSGTKLATLRFSGTGLTGSAVTVSSIDSTYLKNTVTVSDATGFAVGDTVLLSENEPLQATTQHDTSSTNQDFNYREYLTIESISSNDITFEEYIRFPHDTANTLQLQKVSFLENVHVNGGIFVGPNASGGGVSLTHCRYSSVKNVRIKGNSEADKNGGSGVYGTSNWECAFSNISAIHTLYIAQANQNQNCIWSNITGKRTSSGGLIVSGERFGLLQQIAQDASGDDNGDSFQVSNGTRHCVFSDIVVHGASCYTMWMFQSCDNNQISDLKSVSGITAALNIYGDNNRFDNCFISGHGGAGVSDGGTDNRYTAMNVDVQGHGLFSTGSGTQFEGSVRTDPTGSNRDIQLSVSTDLYVRTRNGSSRGVNFSGSNTGYNIIHEGDEPYYSTRGIHGSGWTWSDVITGVGSTPQNVKLIQDDDTEVDWVSRNSSSTAVVYRVTLAFSSALADTISEYLVVDRSSTLTVKPLYEGSGTYASWVPTLSEGSGNIQISTTNAGPNIIIMKVSRF